MAGGNITRIVGGKHFIETDEWIVYTDKFTAYAGKGSHFTADGGTFLGNPKEATSVKKFFDKGWWTDKDGKEITEAQLGDAVQFHLKMRNVYPINSWEDEKVQIELREFDGNIPNFLLYLVTFGLVDVKAHDKINLVMKKKGDEEYVPFNEVQVNSNMLMVINLTLDEEAFVNLIRGDYDSDNEKDIELYFNFSYYSLRYKETETADLPLMESSYLVVKPKPVVEPIILVHASENHLLPAMYSVEDGNPWYIGVKDAAKDVRKGIRKAKKIGKILSPTDELGTWEKKAYEVAVRKLKKGNLIFNTGKKGTTSRYYEYSVNDIDGKFSEKVIMGVNRGSGVAGETTRGINQLEAQSQIGLGKVYRNVGEILGVFGTLTDLAKILSAAANGEPPPIPLIPPFFAWEVERMMADIDETIIEQWNVELKVAILEGQESVKRAVNGNINSEYNLGFNLVSLSEELLNQILKKEIYEYDKSSADFESYIVNKSQGGKDASILLQSIEQQDQYNRPTKFHYIHAIYIKDLKI